MKSRLFFGIAIIRAVFLSCSDNNEVDNYQYYIINIDSTETNDTISVLDTLCIKYWGLVGTNGCYEFSHFNVQKDINAIFITVWGRIDTTQFACPLNEVYLYGKEYRTNKLQKGLLKIYTIQPNGSTIFDSVLIQ